MRVMGTEPGRAHYGALLCAVAVLLCLPVLSVTYAPLVDYPNHLARVHILYHYEEVPTYQSAYAKLIEPIPNLACDLLILSLLPFVGTLAAGKIFLTLSALLFVAGCHLLGRAIHGRPAWLALPCCFFFYNSMLLYGFINYMFGLALFCVALALWLEWRGGWTAARFSFAAFLVFGAYLSHLSAYCFLGVAFVIVTSWHYLAGRRTLGGAALDLSLLLPPAAVFVLFMRGSGEAGAITWNGPAGKLIGLLPLFLSYDYQLDVALMLAVLVVGVTLARRARRIGVDRPVFATGVVLFLLFLLCPKTLFGSSGADVRFIPAAAILLVLSFRIEVSRGAGKILLLSCLAVLAVRVGFIWSTWAALDRRVAAQTRMLRALPPGAKVYPLFVLADDRQLGKTERSFAHVAHYASVYGEAFVPSLFARYGQQPLVFRNKPRYAEPPQGYAGQWVRMSGEWTWYLEDYEYVWCYGVDGELRGLLRDRAAVVYEADGFSLWRLHK